MQKSRIFIVIPVFNENNVLRETVLSLFHEGYRIVIVDDGSTENQKKYLENLEVDFLRHRINLGQGASLQTGTKFSLMQGADIIVHFDADGQHSAKDIPLLIEPLISRKADIVFGSRFLGESKNKIPFAKKIVLNIARYINFLFTGILLTDAHNGLRALTIDAAKTLTIKENRMAHASEILFWVKKKNLKYKEIPVQIIYTEYSKKKGQTIWQSIRILYDLILHKFFE